MDFKEKRIKDLDKIMLNIKKICVDNDIRLGQMIDILQSKYNFDLFNIENDKLNDYFLDYLRENQSLIKW